MFNCVAVVDLMNLCYLLLSNSTPNFVTVSITLYKHTDQTYLLALEYAVTYSVTYCNICCNTVLEHGASVEAIKLLDITQQGVGTV